MHLFVVKRLTEEMVGADTFVNDKSQLEWTNG